MAVDEYIEKVKSVMPKHISVADTIDKALQVAHQVNYNLDAAFDIVSKFKSPEFGFTEWTEEEKISFENAIILYGHELHYVHKEVNLLSIKSIFLIFVIIYMKVATKSMGEIVCFFYKWKKSDRYPLIYSQFCKKHRPG